MAKATYTLEPRYAVTAEFTSAESKLNLKPASTALTFELAQVARGPAGPVGAASTIPGPAGETPDVYDLELPVDPALLFLNALI